MKYQIPGQGELEIKTIILDLNGTLSVGGKIVEGVQDRTSQLRGLGFRLIMFTGNTRGDADEVANKLDIEWMQAANAIDKQKLAMDLEPETCASIGNGLIDMQLTQTVKLGIVTLQSEGVHVHTLLASDIAVPTINDALDLFVDQDRLIATLRK